MICDKVSWYIASAVITDPILYKTIINCETTIFLRFHNCSREVSGKFRNLVLSDGSIASRHGRIINKKIIRQA